MTVRIDPGGGARPGLEIVPPPRSGPPGAMVTLLTAGFFIALPLLGRLPTGADLSALTMVGGPSTASPSSP